MSTNLTLEKFNGPLDLLLQLIEQEKLTITEIALAQVTEQFLGHLSTLGETRSDELADFVVIGSKLVYFKSRELLPYLNPDEAEGPSLADQLKLYKRYAEASKLVEQLWTRGAISYGREEPPRKLAEVVVPKNAKPASLRESMDWVLRRLKPIAPLPQVSIDRSISVRQKVESIFQAVKQWVSFSFSRLIGRPNNKTEVIVSFLALLELAKQDKINVQQGESFGELTIHRV